MHRKIKIFLSYVREDEELARIIKTALNERGYDVWWDQSSLTPGERWENSIKQEIERADYFVTIQSSQSVSKRGNFQKEQRLAIEKQKTLPPNEAFIIPLRVGYCEIAHTEIRAIQWIEFNGNDAVRALSELISRLGGDEFESVPVEKQSKAVSSIVSDVISAVDSENRYQLKAKWYENDLFRVYLGQAISGPLGDREIVLKVPKKIQDNALIVREVETLRYIGLEDTNDSRQIAFLKKVMLPQPIEIVTFTTKSHEHLAGRTASIMRHTNGICNLVEIRSRFPKGLDGVRLAWVIERLLLVLGMIHDKGFILGNISAINVWLLDRDHYEIAHHRAFFGDYSAAFRWERGERYSMRDMYSAPEVGKKLNAHPTSDLYSLGLCLMYLAGGEPSQNWLPPSLDIKIRGFIMCLLEKDRERRPKSAWDELERFKVIRKEVYGEPGLVFMDEK